MGLLKSFIRAAIRQEQIKRRNALKAQKAQEARAAAELNELIGKQKLADDIRAQAREQSQQLLKIIRDCAELVNTTVKPDVFFPRYNLMLEHLESLAGLECTGIFDNSPELPSAAFLRVEEQFKEETNKFLDRSFEAAKKHADTLKTENGKKNAIKRHFDNMEKFIIHMDGESLEYFDKMKAANIE